MPPVATPDPSMMTDITALIAAITALLAVLVWPILIGFALRAYREPITEILSRVRGAKGLGVELEMRDLIESTVEAQTSSSADGIAAPTANTDDEVSSPKGEVAQPATGSRPTRIDLGSVPSDLQYVRSDAVRALLSNWLHAYAASDNTFDSLARINRPSAVLFAWGEVEKRIRQLAEIAGLKSAPTFALIDQLRKDGLIRPTLYPLLKDLNRLRNRVAHSDVDLSDSDIEQFRDSSQTAERELGEMIEEAIRRRRDPSEIARD